MNYPLALSFRILSWGPQIQVTDAIGSLVFYVKQKLFKLKEEVTVFADSEQTRPLYSLKADRVLDFSARYSFFDGQGLPLGSVKRHGMKSLWRAHYEILADSSSAMILREENPWVKVLDGLLNEVPLLGLFTGYFLHPSYLVSWPEGAPLLRLKKQPAFLEARFSIERLNPMGEAEELRALLSLLMFVLMERGRG